MRIITRFTLCTVVAVMIMDYQNDILSMLPEKDRALLLV